MSAAGAASAATELRIGRPDDFHLHLRDGEVLASLAAALPRTFKRAIVMPNLKPPVVTTRDALAYRDRILAALPEGHDFQPLMTLYLTDATEPDEIDRAKESGAVFAVKLYPAGATTNSDSGVTDLERVLPVLRRMAALDMTLCVHGEVTRPSVDIFEREPVFLEERLAWIIRQVPDLRIVLEHITTKEAVAFVQDAEHPRLAATITPQHLMYNRNAIFEGGIRPHMYCLPILKHESDRQALREAVRSGSPQFFLGTDSAPHARSAKEAPCGCAGIFSANAALEHYAQVFEEEGCLHLLDAFASQHGAAFYGLPRNPGSVVLRREDWVVPGALPLGGGEVVPLRAGETLRWRAHVEL